MKWKTAKFGDICTIERGGSPRPIEQFLTTDSSGINWIKIGDAEVNSKFITKTAQKIIQAGVKKSRMVNSGDFLLSNSMSFGRPYILKIDGCIHDGWLVIRDTRNIFDKNFLYHYLGSNRVYNIFKSMVVGGVVSNLNISMVSNLLVPLPPLAEQRRIAAILDKADAIRRKRQQSLELADSLLKSVFLDMFGDMAQPSKWKQVLLETVTDIRVGVVIKPAQYYTTAQEGIKAFRSLNVGEMKINNDNWVYFTIEGNKKNKKSILREGDVLVVRSGYPGTACVVTNEYMGSNAIDVIIARPDVNKINPYYLCAYTNLPPGKNQILQGQGGAAQQHFNIGAYRALHVYLPPINLQNQFAIMVQRLETYKSELLNHLFEADQAFKSLQQSFFG